MDKIQFVNELAKLRPSSTFLALLGYRNAYSEVADYSIVFHMSYKSALQKSLKMLDSLNPISDLQNIARQQLISSFKESLNKMESNPSVEEIGSSYARFYDLNGNHIKGIKLHTRTNTLHLYGSVVHKKILIPGSYPENRDNEFTIVKRKLRLSTPVGHFRQFIIEPNRVNKISVENLNLLPPN